MRTKIINCSLDNQSGGNRKNGWQSGKIIIKQFFCDFTVIKLESANLKYSALSNGKMHRQKRKKNICQKWDSNPRLQE